jgi:hypothetical protein
MFCTICLCLSIQVFFIIICMQTKCNCISIHFFSYNSQEQNQDNRMVQQSFWGHQSAVHAFPLSPDRAVDPAPRSCTHGLPLPLSHTRGSRTPPLISPTDEPQGRAPGEAARQDARPPATGPVQRLPKDDMRSALQQRWQRPRRPIAWRRGSTKAR